MSGTERDRAWLASTEVALAAVHLAVVAGFARLYDDGSFAPDLIATVLGAHLLAALARRFVPAPVAALLAVAGLGAAVAWLLFPDTTTWGLPGTATWDAAVLALRDAREAFPTVAAPTAATVGFQTATVIALWLSAWFADWAAFRLRATVEAVAPAAVLFVFTTMLGSGDHQWWSACAFAAAVLAFVATHRTWRARSDQAWLGDVPHHGPRSLLRAGIGTAVVALAAGALIGPMLPGADSAAVVDWREGAGDDGGDRTTVSPIVDLRRRLVNQSDQVFFRVQANRPAYWRLTALDQFDGELWMIDEDFEVAGRELTTAGVLRSGPDTALRQSFQLDGLDDLWVPAAFEARQVPFSSERLRWDPQTSTLIVDDERDGTFQYRVISEVPSWQPEQLRSRRTRGPEAPAGLTALPDDFPASVSALAREVTAEAVTPYDQMRSLQDWFRSEFTYSTAVQAGHSDEALLDFLEYREGYCEQFAGAFAAMARSLGIPARVAVGFTPGELDPTTGAYVVRGRHAHAWPEVFLPSVGWVPFEPTPGRGIPDAERYTGVPPEQDDTPPPPTDATTTTPEAATTTVPGDPTATTATTAATPPPAAATSTGGGAGGGGATWTWLGLAVLAAAVAWPAAVAVARRRTLRRRRTDGAGRVLSSWRDALGSLRWATGLRPDPSETHAEFARRASSQAADVAEPLLALGDLAGQAAWSPASVGDDEVARAERLGAEVREPAEARLGRWERLRRALSWREANGRA